MKIIIRVIFIVAALALLMGCLQILSEILDPSWDYDHTYNRGDTCSTWVDSEQLKKDHWKSLQDGNLGHYPTTSPYWWVAY